MNRGREERDAGVVEGRRWYRKGKANGARTEAPEGVRAQCQKGKALQDIKELGFPQL